MRLVLTWLADVPKRFARGTVRALAARLSRSLRLPRGLVAAAAVVAEEGVDGGDVVAAVVVVVAAVLAVVRGAGAVHMVLASWSVVCSLSPDLSVREMRPGLCDPTQLPDSRLKYD